MFQHFRLFPADFTNSDHKSVDSATGRMQIDAFTDMGLKLLQP